MYALALVMETDLLLTARSDMASHSNPSVAHGQDRDRSRQQTCERAVLINQMAVSNAFWACLAQASLLIISQGQHVTDYLRHAATMSGRKSRKTT